MLNLDQMIFFKPEFTQNDKIGGKNILFFEYVCHFQSFEIMSSSILCVKTTKKNHDRQQQQQQSQQHHQQQ